MPAPLALRDPHPTTTTTTQTLAHMEENENESGFNGRVVDSSVDETAQSAAL